MEKYTKHKKCLSILLLVVALVCIFQVINIIYYPNKINITKGENKNFSIFFPFTIEVVQDKNNIVNNAHKEASKIGFKHSYSFDTIDTGISKLQFKLLGLIPIKDVEVSIVDRIYLVPGGNSIGVRLNTKGVLVVSVSDIMGTDGKKYSPARDAGIKVGDSIIKINGKQIKNAEHVVEILNNIQENKVSVVVERNQMQFTTEIKPIKSIQDNCYRLGIWVRDKTAGIGTLTFYDNNTKLFGALGHGITDIDTGSLLNVENGKIMKAKVSDIQQGRKGSPGEIKGIFYETDSIMGEITKNTPFGIFGELEDDVMKKNRIKPIPVGLKEEVKEGKAYILTTTNDNKIEKYEIEIVKVQPQLYPEQKSMIIKVTDKKLLQKTGGIVQGMSGSPIIQDEKLIGAVTHVFVNDPTKGYGLYIDWMLQQAGIPIKNNGEFTETKNR